MLLFPELFVPKSAVMGANSKRPVSRHALKPWMRNERIICPAFHSASRASE